ncbi:protein of unknown function [Paraburkholderia kururiensis]
MRDAPLAVSISRHRAAAQRRNKTKSPLEAGFLLICLLTLSLCTVARQLQHAAHSAVLVAGVGFEPTTFGL